MRSYTFRATLSINRWNHVLRLYVPIRSVQPSQQKAAIMSWNYTFLYVPCNRLNKNLQSCPETIRSYTFRATLSQLCEILIRSYTFLLRSYTFLHMFLTFLLESYTFLYVPCNPLAILWDWYTFLYVPMTFLYVPPYVFEYVVGKLYVPIRSVQQYRKSTKTRHSFFWNRPFSLQGFFGQAHIYIFI